MAKVYHHTTAERRTRVIEAVEDQLAIALDVSQVCPKHQQLQTRRLRVAEVFAAGISPRRGGPPTRCLPAVR
jgi:hypothetical protein